jgi:hypothetical protein
VITNAADNARTGWYPDQAALAPSIVGGSSFGQVFNTAVDGQVYAQPLVSGNSLFVVTETNHVYALDATTGAILSSRVFDGTPFNPNDLGCSDLLPTVGITGTPVIDVSTNTAYFFAKSYASGATGPAVWNAHAVDVSTLQERAGFPVTIAGAASNDSSSVFEPTHAHQRPGLLLLDGVVYAGFGSHCDTPPYQGWVVGVTTGGQLRTLWTTEAGQGAGAAAGIWQSGAGLVSDGPGQILFATGNGNSSPVPSPGGQVPAALGEAVVRLSVQADGSLLPSDFFMPNEANYLNSQDDDLGSGGPTALPDSFGTTSVPHLLVQVGKEGYLYLLNRDQLGGFEQALGGGDVVVARVGPNGGLWGRPSVWPGDGGYLYYPSGDGPLQTYAARVDGSGNPTMALAALTDSFGLTSGSAVVTSNGTVSGSALVWLVATANFDGSDAELRAYDPVPVGGALTMRFHAAIGTSSRYEVPGVANGRIYVGTRTGSVLAFGSAMAPLGSGPLDFGTVVLGQSSTRSVTLTANAPLTINGLSTADPEFTIGASSVALPAALNQGDVFTASVTFAPTSLGLHSASLAADTSLGVQAFAMSGVGQAAQATLAANPPAINFGSAGIGHTSSVALSIANQGAQVLTIGGITLPAAPFAVTGLPAVGSTLAAGQVVTANVTFTPGSIGAFTDAVSFTSDGGTATVTLTGTGAAPGHLVVPSSAAAGDVAVGSSGLVSFVVTNDGASRVSITKSKPPSDPTFVVVNDITEGTPIDPGTSVTATLRFSPTAIGPVSDVWVLNADDSGGLRTVALTGNGLAGIPPPAAGGWTLNGSATMVGTTLTLTRPLGNQAGSAFWPTPVTSQYLNVALDATLDQGTGADGLAIAFVDPAGGATQVGVAGGGLGFSGMRGVAVALDTYQNSVNPSGNFVGVADGPGPTPDTLHWLATSSGVPPLRGAPHHVVVTLSAGMLSVSVDGGAALSTQVSLPPQVLVGFTGGTGGLVDRHAVDNVSIVTDPGAPGGADAGAIDASPIDAATGDDGDAVSAVEASATGAPDAGTPNAVAPPSAPIRFVQSVQTHTTDPVVSPLSVTFPQMNNATDLIVCVAYTWPTTGASGVVDSSGNTYRRAVFQTDTVGTEDGMDVWYAWNAAAGSNTVTVSFATPASYNGVVCAEYSGARFASDPLDMAAGTQHVAGSGVTYESVPITAQADGELVVAAVAPANQTCSAGPGFTPEELIADFGSVYEDEVLAKAGTIAASATPPDSDWAMVAAAFRPAP